MAIIRPSSDIVTGGWASTDATLYGAIDEVTPNNADYISSSEAGQTARIALSAASDPGNDDNHVMRYRAATDGDRGLIVRVVETGVFPAIVTSKQPWRRQPNSYDVAIDYSNELAASLRSAVVAGINFDVYTGTPFSILNTSPSKTSTSYGNAIVPVTGSYALSSRHTSVLGKPPVTVFAVIRRIANVQLYGRIAGCGYTDSGGAGGWDLETGSTNSANFVTWNGATPYACLGSTIPLNTLMTIAGTCSGVTSRLYYNGELEQTALANMSASTSTLRYAIGSNLSGTNLPNGGYEIYAVYVFIKELPVQALRDLTRNPWQIFKKVKSIRYIDFGRKVIAERTPTLTSTPTDYSIDLTPAEAGQITNYSALALEFQSA